MSCEQKLKLKIPTPKSERITLLLRKPRLCAVTLACTKRFGLPSSAVAVATATEGWKCDGRVPLEARK
jgi:hypothetical protein